MTESELMFILTGYFLVLCLIFVLIAFAVLEIGRMPEKWKKVLVPLICVSPFLILFLFNYFMDMSAVSNCQKYEVVAAEDKLAYVDDSGTLNPINSELKEAELTTEFEPYYEVIETEYFGGMFKTREEQLYIPIK